MTAMTRAEVCQRIETVGVVPVIRAPSPERATEAAEAILAGGVSVFEITMTVPGAVQIIGELARRLGDEALLGAGTVIDPETADACIDAGARFIVSPALDIPTIERCRKRDIPVCAGALTPTEILTAWRAGANVLHRAAD